MLQEQFKNFLKSPNNDVNFFLLFLKYSSTFLIIRTFQDHYGVSSLVLELFLNLFLNNIRAFLEQF